RISRSRRLNSRLIPSLRRSDGTVTRHRTAFRAQWATRPSILRGQRFVIYGLDTRYFAVIPVAAMDKETHPFVLELLDSYRKVGGLNNQDAHNTPSKRAVGQICEDLLRLLFPGFHDDDAVEHDSLLEITSERMEVVVSRLEDQVRKSVRI